MKKKLPTMAQHADKMHPVSKKPVAASAEAGAADQAAAMQLAPAVAYNKTVAALRKGR